MSRNSGLPNCSPDGWLAMRSVRRGRIFSAVHPKALSSRDSWLPKSAPHIADFLMLSHWKRLHELFTIQSKELTVAEIQTRDRQLNNTSTTSMPYCTE